MASMTYLQLCQLAHRVLRLGNQQPGTFPVGIPAAPNLDQVVYDIVDTVPRAWEKIQDEHPSWNFMRKSGVLVLTAGQRTYTLAQIQAQVTDYYGFIPFWAPNAPFPYFLLFDNGASAPSDYIYPFVEYIDWRGWWDRLPRPANAQPNRLTERPNKTLEFDPTPAASPSGFAANWAIRFDYRQTNQVLAVASDVPILPAEFHEMIAYRAVMLVGEMRQNQGPGVAYAEKEFTVCMDRLKARYLPQIQVDMQYA
jgi:hypothetical protein